jgi:fatty acid desaturase
MALLIIKNKEVMKKNMGSADKIIRFILAAIFVVLYFTGTVTGTWGIVLLVLAGVFVLTSLVSFCPLYAPFGLSSCKTSVE